MARPFDFKDTQKIQARIRQNGRCACCGQDLADLEEHAHHVVPNQSGDAQRVDHRWLSSADNCVILCHTCHERVHQDGRYRAGAIAPPDYFRFSHSAHRTAHRDWVRQLETKSGQIWA